jgi:hypothetical protein
MVQYLYMTDLEYMKASSLHLYIRPLVGEIMEFVVLANELPIYHTTVADVTQRKSPHCGSKCSALEISRKL